MAPTNPTPQPHDGGPNSANIVLLLLHMDSPIEQKIHAGFAQAVQERGYRLISGITPFDPRAEVKRLFGLHGDQIAGLAIQPYVPNRDLAELLLAKPVRNLPHIIVGHHFEDIAINSCVIDNYGGVFEATQRLLAAGRRTPAFIGEIIPSSTEHERYLGFADACLQYGAHVPRSHIIRHYSEDFLTETFREMFREPQNAVRPDAIICMHDQAGALILRVLKKLGIEVPGQIAVMSYGDDIGVAEKCDPPLSTVYHPAWELGYISGQLLINQVEGILPAKPLTYTLPVKMHLRSSCGTCSPAEADAGLLPVPFSNYVGQFMDLETELQLRRRERG